MNVTIFEYILRYKWIRLIAAFINIIKFTVWGISPPSHDFAIKYLFCLFVGHLINLFNFTHICIHF